METQVLLDAAALSRCRRRVHLDHDPSMRDVPLAPPDPAAEQRIADAATHRAQIRQRLADAVPGSWATVPRELPAEERVAMTEQALTQGVTYLWGALLPADREGHRRGGAELLIRTDGGYLPMLVV